jgi:SAM-dependent methyltransferase
MNKWQEYYKDTKSKPPSKLLQEALSFVEDKTDALDLGAGALVDSKYLLLNGFNVVAVDQEKFNEQIQNDKFSFIQSSFNDYEFSRAQFDLITAQFSLPFNGNDGFIELWGKIIASLKSNGIFVGQFFGQNDQWNVPGSELVFHSKKEVDNLLMGLEILKLEEVEEDSKLANKKFKHWHIFHFIVRKTK